MINNISEHVGYLCRNRLSGEYFARVGTEALPSRSEIVAVIVEGVATLTAPDLEKNQVTREALYKVYAAIKAGTSRPPTLTHEQLLIEKLMEKDWVMFDDKTALVEAYRIQLNLRTILSKKDVTLDESWVRNAALFAHRYTGDCTTATAVRTAFRKRFNKAL